MLLSSSTSSVVVRQGSRHEVRRLLKERAEVEVVGVAGRHAVVGDGGAGVELCVGVDVHEGVSLGSVEHVSDAQALQTLHVHGRRPAVGCGRV